MDRRRFLETSSKLACGLTGATSLLVLDPARTSGAPSEPEPGPFIVGPRPPFSSHIGTLISMLNVMRRAVLAPVQGLTVAQLDYLHDAKANTIGALLHHLAAIERLYQIHTFEGKKWGDWDDETKRQWTTAALLGEAARKKIKGNKLAFYLEMLKEVREHTLAELGKRDDAWLMQVDAGFGDEPTNNYCKWFHVCEHESNHNGQVKWLKARLPG
ncbi:MAG TPA: DinB family protein [Chthoniobacterales bacterium]|nr:DinB family protein [Chthoniobacterales bacterium]